MNDDKNRQWILEARPVGHLTGKEFRWQETAIPKPSDGQVLLRNLWLSFDPTQRGWMARDLYVPMIPLGEVMRASGVGQVIETRHPDFKPGDLVQGFWGWQDYLATDGKLLGGIRKLPPGVEPNAALSFFGIHWQHRLFWHDRNRPGEGRRNCRSFRCGRCHRLNRRSDR